MKFVKDYFELGGIVPIALVASAFLAIAGLIGYSVLPTASTPKANMYIEPESIVASTGELFTIKVMVNSIIPVNVFAGEVLFDPSILTIQSIDYNTSVADLWAERPWYSNGDGTLNFTGGTTRKGGFTGTEELITVTFKTLKNGQGTLKIKGARILQHDGLGTDVTLQSPIETIITVNDNSSTNRIIKTTTTPSITYVVSDSLPTTDLNNDGKQNIADVSIFMLYLTTSNLKADFNADGLVNTKDMSILLNAK